MIRRVSLAGLFARRFVGPPFDEANRDGRDCSLAAGAATSGGGAAADTSAGNSGEAVIFGAFGTFSGGVGGPVSRFSSTGAIAVTGALGELSAGAVAVTGAVGELSAGAMAGPRALGELSARAGGPRAGAGRTTLVCASARARG